MISITLFISYFVLFMVAQILQAVWGNHTEPHLFVAITWPFEFYMAAKDRLLKSRRNSTKYVLKMRQKYFNIVNQIN